MLSVLVYESRRPDDATSPRVPGGRTREVVAEMVSVWRGLAELERSHHLDFLRQPDLGFAWAVHRWAGGGTLRSVLQGSELTAGDFVRWCKQVIDFLGQLVSADPDGPLAPTARSAIDLMRRGVVAVNIGQ